ncbi:3-isopropylmalate dehydratase large subunit [Clostridium sp. KNHs216]|uniref:3-isopropylmalate dehydratase large subunit n=1 Tax=Clostridium sp. KNHs216 TaxID=1550235 RepID=UPI0011513317|nr:3-isopropylmalate dehydratase large subunit [Clostridium sp. KNHs216]TQI66335.1 3-isopropylmalate/(R)-2-methylmalate dehydratase large subunit [Clostridium sp. KNHs216]
MSMTISEKILAKASGNENVKAGDIVWAKVDRAMMDDVLGPRVQIAEHMKRLNKKVWDPDKVIIISDHYTPPANENQAEIVKFTRDWAKEYNIKNYYEFCGPCHQVMVEGGHVSPGYLVVGTDSHTCMYGALGAFSTGIGSTEMLGVVATGEIWLKVPETIQFGFSGKIKPGVMAKDLILKAIGTVGHSGATYKAMEFVGDTIRNLPMDERLCMTNMAVETGAKNGIIACDEITKAYLKEVGAAEGETFTSDEDAVYFHKYQFDVSEINPLCACPHEVDNVTEISSVGHVRIDQAYLGSCTGGRYHDLKLAADMLKGRKIAKGIRLLVNPASRQIWERCAKEGILTTLSEAGATVLASSCGACLGVHSGDLAGGEVCISSTNRNFLGRMGSKDSEVYLASPLSVAASAITGEITDPREFL